MQTLRSTLLNYDIDLLRIIANRWDIDLPSRDVRVAAEQLAEAMLLPDKAAHEWSRLNDRERGALQILLGANGRKMALAHYSRLFGEIRQMGPDKRTREKPHLSPVGMAEVLFYRGLIALMYDQGKAGAQPFIYVPSDLADVLPSHETGYDLTKDDSEHTPTLEGESEAPASMRRADTSLVDDITTLLAYMQLESVSLQHGTLRPQDRQALEDYLLGSAHPSRIALMVALMAGLGLVAEQEGAIKPVPNSAKKWLEQPRTRQVKSLIQVWHTSALFNELHFIKGITLEASGWQNDPTLARQIVHSFLQSVPDDQWFAVDEMVALIKEEEPDFQRTDYDSWYIRDAETDAYLKGFDHWDRIEGAMLHGILTDSMLCLGLIDVGTGETGQMVRLTAYGRAYAGMADYPDVPDPETLLTVEADGTVIAPRTLSRYSRFQLARFTEWGALGDGYEYHLSPNGFQQASRQGIKAEHITTFLKRTTQENVPPNIFKLIEKWSQSGGNASVSVRRMVVLETDTEEELKSILNTPDLRRYLGAQLGNRAVAVRSGQWDGLIAELQKRGLLVEQDV